MRPFVETAREVEHRFGQCHHVVFAVGAGSGKFGFPFWKLEPDDWERVLKINLIGAVNVAHAFAPAMAAAASAERDATPPTTQVATHRARCFFFLRSPAKSARRRTRLIVPPRPL